MNRFICRLFALSLMVAGLVFSVSLGSLAEDEPALLVYLIRHAEQTDQSQFNPPLSEIGKARAEWYAEYFADLGVTKIYSSPFIRTRETVAPLAEKLGLNVLDYDPKKLASFAAELKAQEGVILVSGHSNTTPALVNALMGEVRFVDLLHFQFDYIFRVSWNEKGNARVTISRSEPRTH